VLQSNRHSYPFGALEDRQYFEGTGPLNHWKAWLQFRMHRASGFDRPFCFRDDDGLGLFREVLEPCGITTYLAVKDPAKRNGHHRRDHGTTECHFLHVGLDTGNEIIGGSSERVEPLELME
jgi:hypothetical protein